MVLTPPARAIAALAPAVTVIFGSWARGGYALVELLGDVATDTPVRAVIVALAALVLTVLTVLGAAVDGGGAFAYLG